MTIRGGITDFAQVIASCEASGLWCLIGGLAVNSFVEPVYTLDADLVVIAPALGKLAETLKAQGFAIEHREHSLDAQRPGSDLRIHFTTDPRYQVILERSVEAVVLGIPAKVACLIDTAQGKLWAYGDSRHRFSKQKRRIGSNSAC